MDDIITETACMQQAMSAATCQRCTRVSEICTYQFNHIEQTENNLSPKNNIFPHRDNITSL